MNITKHQDSRSNTHEKLIPELSGLMKEGKIDQESASVYAKVSFENQKKIYSILMDNFSNNKSNKMEDQFEEIV